MKKSLAEKLALLIGLGLCLVAIIYLISWGFHGFNLLIIAACFIAAVILTIKHTSKWFYESSLNKTQTISTPGEAKQLLKEARSKKIADYMETLLSIVAVVFLLAFFVSAVCSYISQSGNPMLSSSIRFPLGDAMGIAVDSKGQVFCVAGSYNRVQMYSAEGKFLKGWFVALPKGWPYLEIDEDDNLRIMTSRKKNFLFDENGMFLGTPEPPDDFVQEFGPYRQYETKDSFGNIYKIHNGKFLPKIVKIAPSGEKTVVISDPIYLWIISSPIPCIPLVFVAIIIARILNKCQKKKAKHAVVSP